LKKNPNADLRLAIACIPFWRMLEFNPWASLALARLGGQMHVQFATSRPIRFHRSGAAKSVLWRCPPRPACRLCLMYRPWLSTCPITHLTAGSALPGPRIFRAEIVEVLNREINASLARPEIKAKYDDLGLRIHAGSPADFGKLIADETEKWAKVIKSAGIKAE